MIKSTKFVFITVIFACQIMTAKLYSQDTKWSPEQVNYSSGGKLTYTPDEQGNTIPDFSHVGYMYGDEEIPDIPTIVEVSPVEGDDGASIQAAINQLLVMSPDENGFRGAVLLKKGTYQVKGQIFIKRGGIILRGEGQTDEGTVIIADGTGKRDFIVIGNGQGRDVDLFTRTTIIEDYVPLGRKFVVVDDASGYNAGDQIALYRPGTQNWISDLKMDQIPNDDGQTTQWTPSSYTFFFERLVTEVRGDTIFFRNPVVMAMETKYGGGSVFKSSSDRIQKVGVEDICLKSAYQSDTDEEHAWKGIAFNSVEHSWARRVTSWYFGYACVSVEGSARLITVEDCHSRDPKSIISGGRRYSFNLGGSLNLFKDCSADEGRHDFVTGSRVCGPNVFTNCKATNAHADSGPHHRWAMGTLYDLIDTDGAINAQDRGQSGSGHGWAGANQVFWNCKGGSSICQSPWVSAKNYNFGFIGNKNTGNTERPDGVWVGHNTPGISPESLYLAQLESRLGPLNFVLLPILERVNDSSFILTFNMSFMDVLAVPTNFSITGNAGYEGADFTLSAVNDSSIMVVLDGIGPLPALSSVIVNVDNMLSSSGKGLKGLSYASYYEPDLRPVVSGLYAMVNNEDGALEALSSKPGFIYLVKTTGDYNYLDAYQSVSDLDQAVSENLGRKVDVPDANTSVLISTQGLPGGFYLYFAVDEEGRLSVPAEEWAEVEATGPLLGIDDELKSSGFSVWSSNETIYIEPDKAIAGYSIRLFDITGRLFSISENMMGNQQFVLPDYSGILIVQLISENGFSIRAHKLLHNPSR